MTLDELYRLITAKSITFLPQFLCGLLVFYVFYLFAKFVKNIVLHICQTRGLNLDVIEFFASASKAVVMIVGAITGLGTMGIDVSALVASLGLTGFAVGFALKDLLSNVIAGLMILIHQPFQRNDYITITGFSGIVKDIDLRYTTLENEGHTILLPNSIVFTKAITVSQAGEG